MQMGHYRSINLPEILKDDTYGIEGRYIVSVSTADKQPLAFEDNSLTEAGKAAETVWLQIPTHFNNIDLQGYHIANDIFTGIINIDLTGKKAGRKEFHYNIVSHFEIAFGMMVSHKNPFLIEGSVFHIISWFKASSLINIRKDNGDFCWKPGYFDFTLAPGESPEKIIKTLLKGS